MVKTLVCLANSRKHSGRCLAGLEYLRDRIEPRWIRLAGNRDDHVVTEQENRIGGDPLLLDIIEVPVLRHAPRRNHTEDWIIAPSNGWRLLGRAEWSAVSALAQSASMLWSLAAEESPNRDRIPESLAATFRHSLALLRVPAVSVVVPPVVDGDSRRSIRARFNVEEMEFSLPLTDWHLERQFAARGEGTHSLAECLLTISLSEPFRGFCHRLAAGIIPREIKNR